MFRRVTTAWTGQTPRNPPGGRGLACLLRAASAAVTLCLLAPASSAAQQPGEDAADVGDARVVGIVRDEANREPLPAVRVQLSGAAGAEGVERETTTDDRGVFRFDGLPAGTYRIRARHLQYEGMEGTLELEAGEELPATVLLKPRPVELPGIEAEVSARSWLPGFRWRRDSLDGHFFTKQDIEEQDPARVTDLLRSLPQVRVRYRPGAGWHATMMNRTSGWADDARCRPRIVLDGDWVPRDLVRMSLNDVEPEEILAMEVYWKPGKLPDGLDPPPSVLGAEAAGPGSGIEAEGDRSGRNRGPTSFRGLERVPFSDLRTATCGVVVIWTELETGGAGR